MAVFSKILPPTKTDRVPPLSKGKPGDSSISETRIGQEDGKEQSVNRKQYVLKLGDEETERVKSRHVLIQLKAALDTVATQDFQDDNTCLIAINQPKIVQQEEGNKIRESQVALMETNLIMGGNEVVTLKSNLKAVEKDQDVVMEMGQLNKDGSNFVFNASYVSSNSGEGSQKSKKWKRVVRTSTMVEGGHKSHAVKVSGKKRAGSKGTMVGERKKSREDGELEFAMRSLRRLCQMHSGSATSLKQLSSKIKSCSSDFATWNYCVYGSLGISIDKIEKGVG
ncbi:hypothetical protein COLO4_21852 [Corchorus olitorius]|uniref:Uncharacterized protein n=1 Tax=Corchorus olitorius TaxID=93759 RepID=A0A1R3IQH9_9ROSI|nr:hypothetical protein COLO4_21852 [Corchorus olitorius]